MEAQIRNYAFITFLSYSDCSNTSIILTNPDNCVCCDTQILIHYLFFTHLLVSIIFVYVVAVLTNSKSMYMDFFTISNRISPFIEDGNEIWNRQRIMCRFETKKDMLYFSFLWKKKLLTLASWFLICRTKQRALVRVVWQMLLERPF